jgi:N-acetylmuramoyl-L-alanine amidase
MIRWLLCLAPLSGSMPSAALLHHMAHPIPAAGASVADSGTRKWRVVVDAGHGGRDPGTSGRTQAGQRLDEKAVTLSVAKLLAATLRARGVDVVMTRDSDVYVPLDERGRIANSSNGDIFISVHVNATAPTNPRASSVRGVETYFLSAAKSAEAQRVADMENAASRFDAPGSSGAHDPLAFIMSDMAQNEFLRESSDLAGSVQRGVAARHPGGNQGVKQALFRVLVTSLMPAVLVEIGYVTNTADAQYLSAAANQKQIATSIADAAMGYLQQYNRRVGSARR